jgi:hypothetical protein
MLWFSEFQISSTATELQLWNSLPAAGQKLGWSVTAVELSCKTLLGDYAETGQPPEAALR